MRGRTQPVATWRVLSPLSHAECRIEPLKLRSPLVGRQAELNTLFGALGRLSQGQGGIVTINGEAGLGKSRLVAEARNTLQKHGPGPHSDQPLIWLEGRCLSYASATAYHLWIDLLRNVLRAPPDASPNAVTLDLQQRVAELCPGQCHEIYPYLARLFAFPCRRRLRPAWTPSARSNSSAAHSKQWRPWSCVSPSGHPADRLRRPALVRSQLA